jgi:hypothetical protein
MRINMGTLTVPRPEILSEPNQGKFKMPGRFPPDCRPVPVRRVAANIAKLPSHRGAARLFRAAKTLGAESL